MAGEKACGSGDAVVHEDVGKAVGVSIDQIAGGAPEGDPVSVVADDGGIGEAIARAGLARGGADARQS
jgi:hypothetical protein